jgi:hypothetical protein
MKIDVIIRNFIRDGTHDTVHVAPPTLVTVAVAIFDALERIGAFIVNALLCVMLCKLIIEKLLIYATNL